MNSGKYNALATSLLRVKGTIKIKIPCYLLYFVSLSHIQYNALAWCHWYAIRNTNTKLGNRLDGQNIIYY